MLHCDTVYAQSWGEAVSDDLEARIEALTGRTAAARLRAVMPVIDRKVREGVKHEDIVQALEAAGLRVSLNTFRSYLYRYRKRNRAQAAPSASAHPKTHSSPPAASGEAGPSAPDADADFEAALDPKQRAALGDRYLDRRPPIVRKKRSDPG
jgi:hypothetical protein